MYTAIKKTCIKCKIEKPIDSFPWRSQALGKRKERCKDCLKRYYFSLPHVIEIKRLAQARYSKTKKGKQTERRHGPKRQARIRLLGRDRVYWLVRKNLKKQPCQVCGAESSHAHHDDYSRPLDVNWLCPQHHALAHRTTRSM